MEVQLQFSVNSLDEIPSKLGAANGSALQEAMRANGLLCIENGELRARIAELETRPGALPVPTDEKDSAGVVYDPTQHSVGRSKNVDGTWRKKRGLGKDEMPETAPGAAPKPPKVTLPEMRAALRQIMDVHGKDAAKAILTQHGVDSIGAVKEEQYAAIIASCQGYKPAAAADELDGI